MTPRIRIRFAFAALAFAIAGGAAAQGYPNKPIRLIVPFPAGGTADYSSRTIAQALSERLGQPIVVENRGGADGAIAAQAVIASPPDGYTLFYATNTALNAAPAMHRPTPYEPTTAFTPISRTGTFGFFLIVHESVPAKTAAELFAYIRANPGKVNYGTGNSTSILTTAQIATAEKLDMVHVPYKGDAPAQLDLLTGRIQLMVATMTTSTHGHVKDGKLRVLATLLPNRSPLVPDVPTAAEAGLQGLTITPWGGLFGPAGLPREVVDRVAREMKAVAERRDVKDALDRIAFQVQSSTPDEMASFLAQQLQIWRRSVKELGLERN